MLQSMGSQRVRQDWATELNELKERKSALRLKRCRQSYWNSALVTYSCAHYGGPKGSCLSKSSLLWGGSKSAPQDAGVESYLGEWLMCSLSLFFFDVYRSSIQNCQNLEARYPWVGEWIINLWHIQSHKFIQHLKKKKKKLAIKS